MEGKALKEKSRVEQFERIRRDQRDEGLSVRALAARHRVHRRTVRQALGDAVPPAPKAPVRVSPVLGPHAATVRGWLLADVDVPRKQRHTARRVWQRLVEEEGAQVAESSVRALVAALKIEVGLDRRQVMVPQTHPPGVECLCGIPHKHSYETSGTMRRRAWRSCRVQGAGAAGGLIESA
jgi:hypothetical protein